MKTKILSLFTAGIFALTAVQGAYAAEINMETRAVKAEGKADGVLEGTRYLVKVYNPNVYNNKDTTDFADWYSYIYQGEAEADGVYGFEYVLPENAKNGKYEIETVFENGTAVSDDYFYYFTDEYSDSIAVKVTTPEGSTEEEKLDNLMKSLDNFDNRICLDTDFTSYDELHDKSAAAKKLLDYGTAQSRAEFKKVFSGIETAYRIQEAKASDTELILSRTADAIELSNLSTYKKYLELKDKTKANEFMISSKASDGDELTERLSFYIISSELEGLESWELCRKKLESYNDVLKLDFTQFDSSDSQYSIIDEFFDADYTSVETIASSFNAAVSEKTKKDDDDEPAGTEHGNKHKDTGVGSRGGSGGSSKLTVIETDKNSGTENNSVLFPDVSASHWANAYIAELAGKGVVSGDENGSFNPESSITREEFVKIFVLALDIPDAQSYAAFSDVDENSWSSRYIQSAREYGIVSGTEDGKFLPYDAITRQDLFTIAGRYLTKGEAIEQSVYGFADEDAAEAYAKPYIAYLANEGLITGYADNTVKPYGNCTRAEAAAMICRLASALGKQEVKI